MRLFNCVPVILYAKENEKHEAAIQAHKSHTYPGAPGGQGSCTMGSVKWAEPEEGGMEGVGVS